MFVFLVFFFISFAYYIVLMSTFGVFDLTSVFFDCLPLSSGGSERVTAWGLTVSEEQPTTDIIICLSVCPSLKNPSGLNPDIREYSQAQSRTGVCGLATLHNRARRKE